MNYVFYHEHCTDGFGAAFAAWLSLKDKAEYIPVSYGKINKISDVINLPKVPPDGDSEFYILDFSFPKDVMEDLFKLAKKVVWLDHHKTAFEMYDLPVNQFQEIVDNRHVELDNDRSGAMIAWDYFNPFKEAPMLIKHIDDRDRWQFKLNSSKEVHAALASHKPWSFIQWLTWIPIDEDWDVIDPLADLITEGQALVRAHDENVKAIADMGRRECAIEITVDKEGPEPSQLPSAADGYKRWYDGLACNCPPMFASDVGHELANQSGTFGLCWYQGRDGGARVSLRSNGEYDVSAIAKAFGGGGHRNAAGFAVPLETIQGWLK